MNEIIEKFSWMSGIPDLEQIPQKPNLVRIRGVAGKIGTVSRNKRHYVEEELMKSARTWIGKPVTINHADYTDKKNQVGEVVWMELDKDGLLEYAADIWKTPYTTLLKNKSTDVKGVSIEAGYLKCVCPKCQRQFTNEQEYQTHMREVEYVKEFSLAPRGIIGQALSLVLSPEEPGIIGTTVELMETVDGFTKLCETIVKTGEMKDTMDKIKNPGVALQEARETSTVATPREPKVTTSTPTQPAETKPLSQPELEKQKAEIHAQIMKPTFEFKVDFKPLKTIETTEPKPVIREYGSYEACIASGKSPDECAAIMKACHEETLFRKQTNEALTTINENLNILKENIHALSEATKTHTTNILETIPTDDTSWKEQIANIPKDDLTWKEHLDKHPQDDVTWQQNIKELKTLIETLQKDLPLIKEEVDKKIMETKTKIDEGDKTVMAKFEETKKTFETILAFADKNVTEMKAYTKTLEDKVKEVEAQNVKETAELQAKLQETEKKVQEKSGFKGKQDLPAKTNNPITEDPITKR